MAKTRTRKTANESMPDAPQQDRLTEATTTIAPRQTKAVLLRAMLEAPGGASLTCIMTETGWQAHTVRAALSGLRKAGLHLTPRREGDDTIYAIDAARQGTPNMASQGDSV